MFFTSWSYFVEFLKLLFTVLKNSNYFLRYDWSKSGHITGEIPYGMGKLKRWKTLFHLKSIFYIFQAIFLKFSQSNFYTITKKRNLGFLKFKEKRLLFFIFFIKLFF